MAWSIGGFVFFEAAKIVPFRNAWRAPVVVFFVGEKPKTNENGNGIGECVFLIGYIFRNKEDFAWSMVSFSEVPGVEQKQWIFRVGNLWDVRWMLGSEIKYSTWLNFLQFSVGAWFELGSSWSLDHTCFCKHEYVVFVDVLWNTFL